MNSPDWYLEVKGSKTGPFTLEQIRGLVQEGEVPAQQKVTAAHLGDRWITVEELFSPKEASGSLLESAGEFVPPPRPANLMNPSPSEATESVAGEKTDPTIGLFAALQSVREKKGVVNRYVPPPSGTQGHENLSDRFNSQVFGVIRWVRDFFRRLRGDRRKMVVFVAGLIAVLGFLIWILT